MTISYYRTCNSNKGINASLNLYFNFPSLVFDKCFDLSASLPFEVLHFLPYVAAKIAYNLLNVRYVCCCCCCCSIFEFPVLFYYTMKTENNCTIALLTHYN